MAKTPAALVIYSIKFIVFIFLGARFLVHKSAHSRENQLVLRPARIMIHMTGHTTKRNYNSTKKEVFHKGFLQ